MLSPAKLTLWTALLATPLLGQPNVPAKAGADQGVGLHNPRELAAFIDSFFTPKMEELKIPGAVFSVVKDGALFYSKGYGFADVERGEPADPERTAFYIGSVGKLFTATALMQLIDEGLIDLDANVNDYLDLFQLEDTYAEPVTPRHLLTHTGGFDEGVLEMMAPSAAEIMPLGQYLKKRMPPRVMPPGRLISYSNNGMALAGYLVEAVSGVPYARYVNQNILRPLEMHSSRAELAPPIPEILATGYAYDEASASFKPVVPFFLNASPAGSVYTTAEDMAHFMIAHLQRGRYGDETILSEAAAQQMHQRQFTHDERIPGVGYGFFESFENGHRLLMHGGAIYGYFTTFFIVPDRDLGFFFSCNTFSPDVGNIYWELLQVFFDRYLPASQPAAEPIQVDPAELARVAGHYQTTKTNQRGLLKIFSLMGQVEVEVIEDGQLAVHMLMNPQKEPWRPVGSLLFRQDVTDELAAFGEDGDGEISHLFMQNFAFERIAWYQTRNFHLGLLGFVLVAFLSAVLSWPVGYLIRHLRRRTAPDYRYAARARLLAGGICALNLAFLVGLAANQDIFNLEIAFGLPMVLYALLLVPIATTLLAVLLLPLTVVVWRDRVWSTAARMYYTLVVVAIVVFALFLYYWNLLGIRG